MFKGLIVLGVILALPNASAVRRANFVSLVDNKSNTTLCWAEFIIKNTSTVSQKVKVVGAVSKPHMSNPTGLAAGGGTPSAAFTKSWSSGTITVDAADPTYWVMSPGAVVVSEAVPTATSYKCIADGYVEVKEDSGQVSVDGMFYMSTGGREMGITIPVGGGRFF